MGKFGLFRKRNIFLILLFILISILANRTVVCLESHPSKIENSVATKISSFQPKLFLPLIQKTLATSPPTLHSVSVNPNSAIWGSTINLTFQFQFSDPDGDLDGGTFNFIAPGGSTVSMPIPASYQGQTSGIGYGYLNNVEVEDPKGTYNIPTFLKDKKGKQSNSINILFTIS